MTLVPLKLPAGVSKEEVHAGCDALYRFDLLRASEIDYLALSLAVLTAAQAAREATPEGMSNMTRRSGEPQDRHNPTKTPTPESAQGEHRD